MSRCGGRWRTAATWPAVCCGLLAGGQSVVAVPPILMARTRASVRQRGKSDPIDALAVARAAQREPGLPAARRDEEALELRLLVDHRRTLIAERTRIINRLRWHCHALDPDLAPGLRELSRKCAQAELLRRLDACPVSVRREIAVELVEDIRALTEKITALGRRLTLRVTPLAPNLAAVPGVGAVTAAVLVSETAGVDRFTSKAAFAPACRSGSDTGLERKQRSRPPQPRREPAAECGSRHRAHPAQTRHPPAGPRSLRPAEGEWQDPARGPACPQTPPGRRRLPQSAPRPATQGPHGRDLRPAAERAEQGNQRRDPDAERRAAGGHAEGEQGQGLGMERA
ncbi:transposase [Streptomyces ovatisporus]|uniref:Transposase n=1 Tax=Streptomyces ovatisporus TaxID=1128682 RepID=A0ABV9A721_9ACTN